jgi:hypothetical protein
VPFVRIEMGKGTGKVRRKPQTLTVEQFEVFRTRLDERGNEPLPQPQSYMMGEIVRGVYPQLKKLRENGYTLKMLVRVFEENGVVITIHALLTYLKNLALPKEQPPVKAASKGTVGSPTVEARPGQFQMKSDVTL